MFSKTTGNRSAVWSESLQRAALGSIMKADIDLSGQRQPSEPGAKEAGLRKPACGRRVNERCLSERDALLDARNDATLSAEQKNDGR